MPTKTNTTTQPETPATKKAIIRKPKDRTANASSQVRQMKRRAVSMELPKVDTAPRPELTGVPALMCDLLADILVNGSSYRNLNALVYACADHQKRNLSWAGHGGGKIREQEAREFAEKNSPAWLDALAAFRYSRRGDPEEEQPVPATVSGRIRMAVKDDLRRRFDQFVTDASPEDALLMNSIMMDWEGRLWPGPEQAAHESALGLAFEYALANNQTYVQVPSDLVDHIVSYANALASKTAVPEVETNA